MLMLLRRSWHAKKTTFVSLATDKHEPISCTTDHCLEWLRVVALCRGDTVLTTFEWDGDNLETEYPIARQCVDSNHLLVWSQHNSVDLSTPGLLSKPSAQGQ
jgi:hypothetical protein